MGVNEFQLTEMLPENLKSSLPSVEEIDDLLQMRDFSEVGRGGLTICYKCATSPKSGKWLETRCGGINGVKNECFMPFFRSHRNELGN